MKKLPHARQEKETTKSVLKPRPGVMDRGHPRVAGGANRLQPPQLLVALEERGQSQAKGTRRFPMGVTSAERTPRPHPPLPPYRARGSTGRPELPNEQGTLIHGSHRTSQTHPQQHDMATCRDSVTNGPRNPQTLVGTPVSHACLGLTCTLSRTPRTEARYCSHPPFTRPSTQTPE